MIAAKIKYIQSQLSDVLELLIKNPKQDLIISLITECKKIDDEYKQWCDEWDEDNNQPIEYTYKHGICMEFYIESAAWHDISLILRKLESS